MRDNPAYKDEVINFDNYLKYMHGQVEELVMNYGKIDILWFDYAYGALALHVLETMEGLTRSAQEGKMIHIESTPFDPVQLDWNAPAGCLKTDK